MLAQVDKWWQTTADKWYQGQAHCRLCLDVIVSEECYKKTCWHRSSNDERLLQTNDIKARGIVDFALMSLSQGTARNRHWQKTLSIQIQPLWQCNLNTSVLKVSGLPPASSKLQFLHTVLKAAGSLDTSPARYIVVTLWAQGYCKIGILGNNHFFCHPHTFCSGLKINYHF